MFSDLSKAYIECVERAHKGNANLCWKKRQSGDYFWKGEEEISEKT